MTQLQFSKKSIQLAITDYYSLDTVEYKEDQAIIVNYISKLLQKRLSINELAIRGFIMRAIRSWQIESKIKISQAIKMTSEERIFHVTKIFENLKKELSSVLLNRSGLTVLDTTIEEALQTYIKEFSTRKSKLY